MKNHVLPVSFLIMTGLAVSCINEKPNLSGHIEMDRDTLLIEVSSILGQYKGYIDTVVLRNGYFETSIPDSASFVYFVPKPKSESEMITMCPTRILFLPGDRMTVSGSVNAPEISGTELYDALNLQTEMKAAERAWMEKLQQMHGLYTFDNRNAAAIDSLRKEVRTAVKRLDEARLELVGKEPANIASAYAAIFLPEEESIEAYGMLDESIRNSAIAPVLDYFISYNRNVIQKKQNWKSLQPGVQAPDFRLKNLEGEYMTLDSFKGKYLMLDFWGTWCGWCIKGIPDMKKYYEKYKDRIEFASIDCRDTEEEWREGVAEHELPWTNLFNGDGKEIILAYGIQAYPTMIIIDPEGKVVGAYVGENPALYEKLDELFR